MSVGDRIRQELREIGLVTLYFLSCFLIFLSLKKLLLESYEVEVTVFRTAIISALVVAKVVVLLEKTSFGNWFSGGLPIFHVFWRSLTYTLVVFLVTIAERVFELYREQGGLPAASELWTGKDLDHYLAMNVAVGLAFLAYNSFAEIDRSLGEGGLRRLFFRPSA